MYFEDGSYYDLFLKTPIDTVTNVGWLDKEKEFKKGKIEEKLLEKLSQILNLTGNVDVHVNWLRSLDLCEIAGCKGSVASYGGTDVQLGGSEVWLPSTKPGEYFASPSLIYHYIKEHGYCPLDGFLEAIESFDLKAPYIAQDIYLEKVKGHF